MARATIERQTCIEAGTPVKCCSRCGIRKPISAYSCYSHKKGGYQNYCKECAREYYQQNKNKISERDREYRQQNRDRISEYHREYYQQNKNKISERHREYRQQNKNKISERHREYRQQNRDRISEYHREYYREYYQQNKNRIREHDREYRQTTNGKMVAIRARHIRRVCERNTEATLTATQWQKIIEYQGNKCTLCGKNFTKSHKPTIDHIIPLSQGGGLTAENVQALCRSCNSSKQAKLYLGLIQTWAFTAPVKAQEAR